VGICDIQSETLKETHRLVEKTGVKSFYKVFDITNISAIEYFVNEVGKALRAISVLVNNAAIMLNSHVEDITEDIVDEILQVNLKAPIFFTKFAVPWMKKVGGSIINMASVTGHNGFPDVVIYGATKGGLMALTRGHAMEFEPYKIRVNTVSLGTVNSPMSHQFLQESSDDPQRALTKYDRIYPRGVMGSIEDFANVFVFLASDASVNITAEDIRCDGGYCVQGGLLQNNIN
jgi:NAD(P)-dependent dehydrogenase (short-subunit alcohol dehydrogenase family)